MQNFVTLYDSGYLSRGIALYESLVSKCSEEFHMYVLAMDDNVKLYWTNMYCDNVVVFTPDDMQCLYPELKQIKNERPYTEFCWTCSSYSIQYVFRNFGVDSCTYLDSDIFFFSDPLCLIKEMEDGFSVLITEHNNTPMYDQVATSGKYCVQFMYFINNNDGNRVLEWWRQRCQESCGCDPENGIFGDQKYLDDWESRFEGIVYNCKNMGCGIAPWNLQKYNLTKEDRDIYVTDKVTKVSSSLIFFHFHQLKQITNNSWRISTYLTDEYFKDMIYRPYIKRLLEIESQNDYCKKIGSVNSKKLMVLRVLPLPFFQQAFSLNIHYNDNEIVVENINENNKLLLKYEIKDNSWIKITKIDNIQLFIENFHEIIWEINRKLIYNTIKDENDVIYKIFDNKNNNKKVMTEITSDVVNIEEIRYPDKMIREVLRVFSCEDIDELDYYDIPVEYIMMI